METTIEILKLLTHAGAIAVLIVIVIKLNGLLDGLNNIHNGLSPLSELEIINEKLNVRW
ncbi:22731_t:CDS:2 [Rhizophagus irregularis]|nr:22731_t:CDS:2 [Rhizophagus irregularis]